MIPRKPIPVARPLRMLKGSDMTVDVELPNGRTVAVHRLTPDEYQSLVNNANIAMRVKNLRRRAKALMSCYKLAKQITPQATATEIDSLSLNRLIVLLMAAGGHKDPLAVGRQFVTEMTTKPTDSTRS